MLRRTSFAYMSHELMETTLTCSARLRKSMSSTMSSSAHLRVCSEGEGGVKVGVMVGPRQVVGGGDHYSGC